MILDSVHTLAHNVILKVQQLEAREKVLYELADLQCQRHVAHGDRVHGEPAELIGDIGERQQILFDGDVEGVAVLDVDGHSQNLADLLDREEATEFAGAGLRAQAAEPGCEEDAGDHVLDAAGPSVIVLVVRVLRAELGELSYAFNLGLDAGLFNSLE